MKPHAHMRHMHFKAVGKITQLVGWQRQASDSGNLIPEPVVKPGPEIIFPVQMAGLGEMKFNKAVVSFQELTETL